MFYSRKHSPPFDRLVAWTRDAFELAIAFLTLDDGYEATWESQEIREIPSHQRGRQVHDVQPALRAPRRRPPAEPVASRGRHPHRIAGGSRPSPGRWSPGLRRHGAIGATPQHCTSPLPAPSALHSDSTRAHVPAS
jgi:hypothetical protein